MPGVFRCPECDFQLSKQSMCASSGVVGVSAQDRETEECPNDGTMMVPVTYREQLAAYEKRLFEELDAKDALSAALKEKTVTALFDGENQVLMPKAELAALREENERLTRELRTEIAMHAAWRKRAEALEAQLPAIQKPVTDEEVHAAAGTGFSARNETLHDFLLEFANRFLASRLGSPSTQK